MRKLSKIVVPALMAAAALGVAGPASAHSYHGRDGHGWHEDARTPARASMIRNQIADLQRRVDRNDRREFISEREARGLRRDVGNLYDQFRRYNRDGLSDREFRTLQARIDTVRHRLHLERADWNGHRS